MRYVLIVRCWKCGTSVVFANLHAAHADETELATGFTRVVRAVLDIVTARRARVLEGVCVDCVLEARHSVSRETPSAQLEIPSAPGAVGSSAGGGPPAPDPSYPEEFVTHAKEESK